jgi:hypothetical protein
LSSQSILLPREFLFYYNKKERKKRMELMDLMKKMSEESKNLEHIQECKTVRNDGIIIVSQSPLGTSKWADWVREGRLKSTDIFWAFKIEEGKRDWKAVFLSRKKGSYQFFDLTTEEGKSRLRGLEEFLVLKLAKTI